MSRTTLSGSIFMLLCLVIAIACAGPGCTTKSEGNGAHDHDGDDHSHEEGDADHDHDHEGDDHDHGEPHELGTAQIGETALKEIQFGEIAGGTEASIEIEVTAGNPDTIRLWIGAQNGRGSIKARAEKEGEKNYHGHVECPIVIAADHLLWIEVESGGKKQMSSLPLHR